MRGTLPSSSSVPRYAEVTLHITAVCPDANDPLCSRHISETILSLDEGLSVLGSSGCYNKISLTELLKQQTFISHDSGG